MIPPPRQTMGAARGFLKGRLADCSLGRTCEATHGGFPRTLRLQPRRALTPEAKRCGNPSAQIVGAQMHVLVEEEPAQLPRKRLGQER